MKIKFNALGYTLIELLVVVAILVIIGTTAAVNFTTYRKQQDLDVVLKDVHSKLRLVQTDATANVLCTLSSGSTRDTISWKAEISRNLSMIRDQIKILCEYDNSGTASALVNTFDLPVNVLVQKAYTENSFCAETDFANYPLIVYFAPLTGSIKFTSQNPIITSCLGQAAKLNILVQSNNINPPQTGIVVIEKSGSIYVE